MSSSASPAPGPLARFSASIDKGMERFFHRLGERIADRPWTFIIASLVATAVFASGIAFINIEANAELLYTDQSSAAFDDRDFAEDNFGADNRQSKLFMTARPKGANVLTKANLLELLDVYETAVALTARYDGESYTLSRVCATPNDDGVCDVVSVLDYWSYNRTLIQDDPDILATVNAPARDGIGREIRESSVLGGVTRDAQGNITAAAAFQLEVDNKVIRIAIEGAADDDPYTTEWELAFADLVNDWPRHATSELFVLTQASQDKEFDKAIEADVSLLIVGYILLLIFAAIVMSRNHRVYSSTSISFATVMAVGMAIASSYGVCMAAGVDFSLVVNTLALLLLGLGVDDTFVIMSALRKEKLDVPIRERMATALAKAGASITTTSLTDFAAFLSGTITVLPALQAFCIYAAVGIAFTLVFQVTFVSPCLVLDMRRQKRRKRDVLCCMAPVSDADFQPVVSKPIDSPEEDELAQASDAAEFNYNEPSIMSRMVGRYMPKYTLSVPGIVTIVLGSVALFAVAVYGLTQVETNFDIEWFAPESSYLNDVYDVRDSYFKGRFLPFKTYTKRADYFANQDGLSDISAALKSDSWVLDGSVRSWYDGYLEWLPTSTHAGDLVDGKPGNSADFHSWLVEFLETSESGLQYRSDVIFTDATKTAVLAARMHALLGVRDGSQDNIDAMDSVRVAAKAGQGKAFNGIAFTYPFLFFEGDKIIASETIRNVCVAAAFVFVISFVLLANLHAALIVLFIVALADVVLLGFVHWLGLYFNAVSAINLLIAVGILVDSLLHLMREYVVAVGTRDERAREALWMIGGAVANGCISTFLAVVVMANAQSFIFRTFFKMWATILALAVFSGLCLLPVCLKFFGPAELPWRRAEKEAKGKEARTSSSKALGGDVELGGAKADTSGSEDDRAAVRPAQVVPQEQ